MANNTISSLVSLLTSIWNNKMPRQIIEYAYCIVTKTQSTFLLLFRSLHSECKSPIIQSKYCSTYSLCSTVASCPIWKSSFQRTTHNTPQSLSFDLENVKLREKTLLLLSLGQLLEVGNCVERKKENGGRVDILNRLNLNIVPNFITLIGNIE